MKPDLKPAFIEDLRFALATMEERSHLGLDANTAATFRSRVLTRIAAIEHAPDDDSEPVVIAEVPE